MKGREGDYPPGTGVHVTRVHSHDEFDEPFSWMDFCRTNGIEPDVGRNEQLDGEVSTWPLAIATCSCRWSRPAVSRVMARSGAFVHHQLGKL